MTDMLDDQLASRRDVLRGSAKLGGGAAALSLAGSSAVAAGGDDTDDVSNVDVLNYALTLEKLEYTFYRDGLEMFDEQEFEHSRPAKLFAADTLQYSTYNFFELIRDHEEAHVDAITKVINKLGGEPVSGLKFEFPYETIEEFVAVAMALENTGVSAYTGAIDLLEGDELLTAAATIATVEGRHASYLNLLNRKPPFPRAFDEPKSMEEVKEIASQFIV